MASHVMDFQPVKLVAQYFRTLAHELREAQQLPFWEYSGQVLQVVLTAPNNASVAWSISIDPSQATVSPPTSVANLRDQTVSARLTAPLHVAASVIKGTISPMHVIGHPEVSVIGNIHQFDFIIPQALRAAKRCGFPLSKQTHGYTEVTTAQIGSESQSQAATKNPSIAFSTVRPPLSMGDNAGSHISQHSKVAPSYASALLRNLNTSASKQIPEDADIQPTPIQREHSKRPQERGGDVKAQKLYTTPADSYRNAQKLKIHSDGKQSDESTKTAAAKAGIAMFSACIACRNSRVRCDYNGTGPCSRCIRLSLHCTPAPTLRRRRRKLPAKDGGTDGKDGQNGSRSREPRRAACAACKRSKVKCGVNPENPTGDCERCIRMSIPCVKLVSTPGRPLARRTRELKIPSYAPPDLTTFPGIMVPSFQAAREHVIGAYPILALDEVLFKVREAYEIRSKNSGWEMETLETNPVGSPVPSPRPDIEVGCVDDLLREDVAHGVGRHFGGFGQVGNGGGAASAEQFDREVQFSPRLLRWWCRALLTLAVEERSKSEFKVCLQLASLMGMNLDRLMAGLPGTSFDALRNEPDVQIKRDENHAFKQPYIRPAMPKLAGFVEVLANSADPAVASITMAIRNGRRTGTCNLRFAEMFLTNRTLDGFTMNGLAKPWYDLIVPGDVRAFFNNCMMQACLGKEEEEQKKREDLRFSFVNSHSTVMRDKNDRQWRGVLEFRMHLAEGGDVCDCTFGIRHMQVLPKSEYITWPKNSEADAKGLTTNDGVKNEPRTPEGWSEKDEFYWKQGSVSREPDAPPTGHTTAPYVQQQQAHYPHYPEMVSNGNMYATAQGIRMQRQAPVPGGDRMPHGIAQHQYSQHIPQHGYHQQAGFINTLDPRYNPRGFAAESVPQGIGLQDDRWQRNAGPLDTAGFQLGGDDTLEDFDAFFGQFAG